MLVLCMKIMHCPLVNYALLAAMHGTVFCKPLAGTGEVLAENKFGTF